jgi:PII-like signaling protein
VELKAEAKLLRIFLGETDKVKHTALYEVIVREARGRGLAGATAWRGLMGFGPTSRIRTSRILDLSADLPVIVEIVDEEEKIDLFLPLLHDLFESARCGGLITVEKVKVIKYLHGPNPRETDGGPGGPVTGGAGQ